MTPAGVDGELRAIARGLIDIRSRIGRCAVALQPGAGSYSKESVAAETASCHVLTAITSLTKLAEDLTRPPMAEVKLQDGSTFSVEQPR